MSKCIHQLPLEATHLYQWMRRYGCGYWIVGDGVLIVSFYKPSRWERFWRSLLWDETFVPYEGSWTTN